MSVPQEEDLASPSQFRVLKMSFGKDFARNDREGDEQRPLLAAPTNIQLSPALVTARQASAFPTPLSTRSVTSAASSSSTRSRTKRKKTGQNPVQNAPSPFPVSSGVQLPPFQAFYSLHPLLENHAYTGPGPGTPSLLCNPSLDPMVPMMGVSMDVHRDFEKLVGVRLIPVTVPNAFHQHANFSMLSPSLPRLPFLPASLVASADTLIELIDNQTSVFKKELDLCRKHAKAAEQKTESDQTIEILERTVKELEDSRAEERKKWEESRLEEAKKREVLEKMVDNFWNAGREDERRQHAAEIARLKEEAKTERMVAAEKLRAVSTRLDADLALATQTHSQEIQTLREEHRKEMEEARVVYGKRCDYILASNETLKEEREQILSALEAVENRLAEAQKEKEKLAADALTLDTLEKLVAELKKAGDAQDLRRQHEAEIARLKEETERERTEAVMKIQVISGQIQAALIAADQAHASQMDTLREEHRKTNETLLKEKTRLSHALQEAERENASLLGEMSTLKGKAGRKRTSTNTPRQSPTKRPRTQTQLEPSIIRSRRTELKDGAELTVDFVSPSEKSGYDDGYDWLFTY